MTVILFWTSYITLKKDFHCVILFYCCQTYLVNSLLLSLDVDPKKMKMSKSLKCVKMLCLSLCFGKFVFYYFLLVLHSFQIPLYPSFQNIFSFKKCYFNFVFFLNCNFKNVILISYFFLTAWTYFLLHEFSKCCQFWLSFFSQKIGFQLCPLSS